MSATATTPSASHVGSDAIKGGLGLLILSVGAGIIIGWRVGTTTTVGELLGTPVVDKTFNWLLFSIFAAAGLIAFAVLAAISLLLPPDPKWQNGAAQQAARRKAAAVHTKPLA